ncbi:THUMP domain-containing protein 3 [Portunus trituberculatus]|uniref:THUMP domain-containing protein 3 n=2 Tax=Portunus trituberculatus TaxID=210409 RepID=A0A5B7EI01_PORTR|nr:THUMP domain-containing protein 3 [Portunus trituberculatus]
MVKKFSFEDQRERSFEKLYKFAEKQDWRKGMQVWKDVVSYPEEPIKKVVPLKNEYCCPRPDVDLKKMKLLSPVLKNLPENVVPEHLRNDKGLSVVDDSSKQKEKSEELPSTAPTEAVASGPKFRVSCSRTGSNHKFGSPEAARQFGAGVNEMFMWPVDLTNFDLEILLCIDTEFVYVAVSLTREPLFKRNLTNFGRTNLRSTVCHNMVRLATPQLGEVVLDPMCGGATIPMEGSLTHRQAFHLGGDNYGQAVKRSRENINNLLKKGKSMAVDVAWWDATKLPLRNQCVDVVVSDLPFGKRSGSVADNRILYYRSLVELARVTKMKTGRAVLLTYDKRSMIKNIKRVHTLWKSGASRTVNIGGLPAVIYTLYRTSQLSLSDCNEDSKVSETCTDHDLV